MQFKQNLSLFTKDAMKIYLLRMWYDGYSPGAVLKGIFLPGEEVEEQEYGDEDNGISGHHKSTRAPLNLCNQKQCHSPVLLCTTEYGMQC